MAWGWEVYTTQCITVMTTTTCIGDMEDDIVVAAYLVAVARSVIGFMTTTIITRYALHLGTWVSPVEFLEVGSWFLIVCSDRLNTVSSLSYFPFFIRGYRCHRHAEDSSSFLTNNIRRLSRLVFFLFLALLCINTFRLLEASSYIVISHGGIFLTRFFFISAAP